jgi:hypothetical protein
MKIATLPLVLISLLLPQVFDSDNELALLSSKIEMNLQERGWRLKEKLVYSGTTYHYWQAGPDLVKVSFFIVPDSYEAERLMREDLRGLRAELGGSNKLEGIGDEAHEWKGLKDDRALIYFRKRGVIVGVVGPTAEITKEFAGRIASVLARSERAKDAA